MNRKLKVYTVGDPWKCTTQPQIRLQGKWLREAGFKPHDHIIVKQEGGRLVIEHRDDP